MTTVTSPIRNGVDTERLFATLFLIKAQPELARFRFRATNRPRSAVYDMAPTACQSPRT